MKIAQVTPVYTPYVGGIGAVAQEYAKELSLRSNEVVVFTPKYSHFTSPPDKGEEVGVVYLTPLYKWGNAALIPQLIWKLRNFDIIHLHYPFYGGAESAALASLIWHIPLVITYHMKPVSVGWQEWIFRIYRVLFEPIIFLISKAICVSSLDYARSVDLKNKKLVELPFFVATNDTDVCLGNDVRAKHGITQNAKVIIFVGGLDSAHYFKGVDVLLGACSKIKKDINWHLIIVGDGNLKNKYENIAQDNNISDRVHFVGRVNNEELHEFYKASDIHVLPSINKCEAFGLVTLEAASCGLPSIVSNLPGVRTLVKDKETGLIVRPCDEAGLLSAIEYLLVNDDFRVLCGNNARKMIADKYSRMKVIDRLITIYENRNHH